MNTKTVSDVVRCAMDASDVLLDYHAGRIGDAEAIELLEGLGAMHWTECGSPWAEYGAFICECCVASEIEDLMG